jgi:hypothetical protein
LLTLDFKNVRWTTKTSTEFGWWSIVSQRNGASVFIWAWSKKGLN